MSHPSSDYAGIIPEDINLADYDQDELNALFIILEAGSIQEEQANEKGILIAQQEDIAKVGHIEWVLIRNSRAAYEDPLGLLNTIREAVSADDYDDLSNIKEMRTSVRRVSDKVDTARLMAHHHGWRE